MSKEMTMVDAQQKIVSELGKGNKTRKELIDLGLKGLTNEERADKRPGAALNRRRCLFGNAIEWLVNSGRVRRENDKYQLVRQGKQQEAVKQVVEDEEIRELILKLLKQPMTKKELLNAVAEHFTGSKKNDNRNKAIKSSAGQVLAALITAEEITGKGGQYALPSREKAAEKRIVTIERLTAIGSETLVDVSMELFQKIYEARGYQILRCENIDGGQDGGIDGVIVMEDELGFSEKIIVQVKQKKPQPNKKTLKNVPECEVREFCGVLSADADAVKGIFVTNSQYSTDTKNFAKKYKHKAFTLLEGKTFCELAKKYGFTFSESQITMQG